MSVIVITGASQGIGAEIAKAFAHSSQHTLILLARSEDKLKKITEECKQAGSDAHYFLCDVVNDAQVASVAKQILQQWGAPDILVNNAGAYEPSSFSDTSGKEFRAQIDVNLTSAFLVTQAFFDAMLARKSGDVFFICSVASVFAHPGSVGYCAAKHGLLGLARTLRTATKDKGIRVTSLLLGETLTPAWGVPEKSTDEFIQADEVGKLIVDIHTLKRSTNIDEILIKPQKGGFVLQSY